MLAQYLTFTGEQVVAEEAIFELGNYDYAVIQAVGMSGEGAALTIESTLDSGAVQGETDGNYLLADNYAQVAALSLLDGTTYSPTISADGLYKLFVGGRYVKLTVNEGGSVNLVFVGLYKIS